MGALATSSRGAASPARDSDGLGKRRNPSSPQPAAKRGIRDCRGPPVVRAPASNRQAEPNRTTRKAKTGSIRRCRVASAHGRTPQEVFGRCGQPVPTIPGRSSGRQPPPVDRQRGAPVLRLRAESVESSRRSSALVSMRSGSERRAKAASDMDRSLETVAAQARPAAFFAAASGRPRPGTATRLLHRQLRSLWHPLSGRLPAGSRPP